MASPDVLVTGACGHLGFALMSSLLEYGYTPLGVDILPSRTDEHKILVGSIAKPEFVAKVFGAYPSLRYVLHTATLHKPHVGSHSKAEFIETNNHGTLNLLESACSHSVPIEAFIFTSTTSTFGHALAPAKGQPAAWITEDVVPVPKNIYGTTKVAAEDLCQLIQAETKMPTIVLRTSRFFPEEDDSETARAEFSDDNLKVCELMYRRVDIHDVVTAHVCAMRAAPRIGWGKYIISAPPPFKNIPRVLQGLDANATREIVEACPDQAEALRGIGWKLPSRLDRIYDSRKAMRELEWRPEYTFEHAVQCIKQGKGWRSELTLKTGKRGYHAVPTGVYTL